MSERPARRELPQLLIRLVAAALAIAIAIPVTASIVMNGVRDVKRTRDTIVVTGSAKQPIEVNLADWYVSVSVRERTPVAAAWAVRTKIAAVKSFLGDAGLTGDT